MKRAIAAVVVAVAAAVAVNVLLLGSGSEHHDPVGRLSPVAQLGTPTPRPQPAPPATTMNHGDRRTGTADD